MRLERAWEALKDGSLHWTEFGSDDGGGSDVASSVITLTNGNLRISCAY